MHRLTAGRRFLALLAVGILLHAALLAIVGVMAGIDAVVSEDGPLEQSQNLVLLTASVLFFLAAWRLRGSPRMAAFDAAVLCVIFFLRELELPPGGLITTYLKSHTFRWHEGVVLLAVLLPYAVLRWRFVLELIAYVVKLQAWPFFIAGALLVLGGVFEETGGRLIVYPYSVLLEELTESSGYLVLLLIACLFVKRSGPADDAAQAATGQKRVKPDPL